MGVTSPAPQLVSLQTCKDRQPATGGGETKGVTHVDALAELGQAVADRGEGGGRGEQQERQRRGEGRPPARAGPRHGGSGLGRGKRRRTRGGGEGMAGRAFVVRFRDERRGSAGLRRDGDPWIPAGM